jgi:uncharacterized protein (TIGR04255 family)
VEMNEVSNPFAGPAPAEVPLSSAPLLRVVAQVRFPLIASIERREFIGPFQEAIRGDYPVLRSEQTVGAVLGPHGVVETQAPSITWRFHDRSGTWRASLAPGFVALETTAYTSRADFLGRLERLLRTTDQHIDPLVVDRLGIRYIDRIAWAGSDDFGKLVRTQVAGILAGPFGDSARQALTHSVFSLPDGAGELMARWGLMPANSTIDPAAVEPMDAASWILDLDAYAAQEQPMDVDSLMEQAGAFAERIYSFFRWAVTTEFLERFGGEL